VNPLGLSSESSDPSTWGTGVTRAIHRSLLLLRGRLSQKSHAQTLPNLWRIFPEGSFPLAALGNGIRNVLRLVVDEMMFADNRPRNSNTRWDGWATSRRDSPEGNTGPTA